MNTKWDAAWPASGSGRPAGASRLRATALPEARPSLAPGIRLKIIYSPQNWQSRRIKTSMAPRTGAAEDSEPSTVPDCGTAEEFKFPRCPELRLLENQQIPGPINSKTG